MATTARLFTATVPHGTPTTAPVTVDLAVGMAAVDRIRWRVPPGPRGELGWFLAMGGTQVIPTGTGLYIVADDETDTWDLSDLPDEGEWQLVGYNTGTYDHSVFLWFYTSPLTTPTPAAPGAIDATALSSG